MFADANAACMSVTEGEVVSVGAHAIYQGGSSQVSLKTVRVVSD